MKYIIQGVLFFLIGNFVSCNMIPGMDVQEIRNTTEQTTEEKPNTEKLIDQKELVLRYAVSDATAIEDIVFVWQMLFDKANAKKNDWRRAKFQEYATEMVKILRYYQNPNMDKNIREWSMPDNRFTHILIAYMIYRESSVDPTVIAKSSLKEVGLLQVHGKALKGHSREEVVGDYRLGIWLGIDWMARMINECGMSIEDFEKPTDWLGPLANYGAGARKAMKNGKCSTKFFFAKERVRDSKHLMSRILANV